MSEQSRPPQFIWTYWHEGAVEDELRWSIRSIEKFSEEGSQVIVAGDAPGWFRGHSIKIPKIDEVPNHNFQDVIWKIRVIMDHPDVCDEFVWMMDDVVAVHPFSISQIKTPRAFQWPGLDSLRRKKKYFRLKQNTLNFLQTRGYSGEWDFGTHAPHLIRKKELKSIFEDWPIQAETLLWEIVYEVVTNQIRMGTFTVSDPSPFLTTQSSPFTPHQLEDIERDPSRVFLNWGNKEGWTPILRNWLEAILPTPSEFETDSNLIDRVGTSQQILKSRNS